MSSDGSANVGKSDRSGWSEERKDWLGNKYIQHFDSHGDKSGRSESKTDWLGSEYTQHYDSHSNKTGWSESKKDWLGDDYVQDYDSDNNKMGWSEDRKDWLGSDYEQHYDDASDKSGYSEQRTTLLGDEYTQHYGGGGRRSHSSRPSGAESRANTSGFSGGYETGGGYGSYSSPPYRRPVKQASPLEYIVPVVGLIVIGLALYYFRVWFPPLVDAIIRGLLEAIFGGPPITR
jgi:hypothetical protein